MNCGRRRPQAVNIGKRILIRMRWPGRAAIMLALVGCMPEPGFGQSPEMTTAAFPVEFTSSNLPIVVINTGGRAIVDERRIPAHMGIIANSDGGRNHLTDPFNDYDGRIAIELRGSATQLYPKKQYRFETQDSTGENLNVSLLGLPPENDWIFYGPYDDQSLIRNVLAYRLSNRIGRYASRSRFCELVLNGEYRGLYVLLEKIKRDKNRVDIARLDAADTTGEARTGGYIIKIDKWQGENLGGWTSRMGTKYQYHYPHADDIRPEQKIYIWHFMDAFESLMFSPGFADPDSGYPRLLEVDAAVDHFLLNELAKNVDAYRISAFMYKDRDRNGGKLTMGPIWDFNLSFGKAWYPEDLFLTGGWQVDYNTHRPWDNLKVPFWWIKLSREPGFVRRAVTRWQALRRGPFHVDSLYASIDTLTERIAEARVRNFQRWPETAREHSYAAEIAQMKQWIAARLDWIDANLEKLSAATPVAQHSPLPQRIALLQNYPNPFNAQTRIPYRLGRALFMTLKILTLAGAEICTLQQGLKAAGEHYAIWRGTDASGLAVASGMYICELRAGGARASRKILLLR